MFTKKLFVAVVSSAVLFASIPAEASFGRPSGSPASSRSSSRVSLSKSPSYSSSTSSRSSTSTTTSSGGISGGQSLGMSRSAVANNVRSGNYAAPANGTTVAGSNPGGNNYNRGSAAPAYNNSNPGYNGGSGYNNGGYAQPQPSSGHSTGTVLGAAAVAGAAGYMLGNHNSNSNQPVIINNGTNGGGNPGYNNGGYNGGVAPAADYNNGNNAGYANPVVVHQSSGGGFGGFIWSLIKILLGLIVLGFIIKFLISLFRKSQSSTPTTNFGGTVFNSKTPEDEIRDIKEQFFIDFQKNNRPSGLDYIRSHSEPMFFDAVEDMVRNSSDTRFVKVKQLEAELVDLTQEGTRYIASVRYKAHVVEGEQGENGVDTPINEMWNFVYSNGTWKLAGIDQL